LKKEVHKLEDSNVENIGSAEDKAARVAAASTEKAWAKAGKKPGMQIWRIEKFKVKKSKTPVGTFYNDDSYICLNTYKKPDQEKLFWDVHFWLGTTTSQDEQGTAAYKTVELDDFLGGDPVQHREVSGHESSLFLGYFKECGGIKLLEGGVESGFNHVKPEEYRARLLHVKGKKKVRVVEVPLKVDSLNIGDVFILDNGMDIYQWQGKAAGRMEKWAAGNLCRAIDDERRGKPEVHVMTQGDKDEAVFFKFFGEGVDSSAVQGEGADDAEWEKKSEKIMFQLSDASGSLTFTEVCKGKLDKSKLNGDDVFIVDCGCEIFVWIGSKSSKEERRNGMKYAQQYLKDFGRPDFLPISKIQEKGENDAFNAAFFG